MEIYLVFPFCERSSVDKLHLQQQLVEHVPSQAALRGEPALRFALRRAIETGNVSEEYFTAACPLVLRDILAELDKWREVGRSLGVPGSPTAPAPADEVAPASADEAANLLAPDLAHRSLRRVARDFIKEFAFLDAERLLRLDLELKGSGGSSLSDLKDRVALSLASTKEGGSQSWDRLIDALQELSGAIESVPESELFALDKEPQTFPQLLLLTRLARHSIRNYQEAHA